MGGLHLLGGLHSGRRLGRPPSSDTTRYGQRAGGTHPTGMHSCLMNVSENFTNVSKHFIL